MGKQGNSLDFGISIKKAWMTGVFFQKYLLRLDRHVNHPMDNAPSHVTEGLILHNIKILPLPANTTSKYHPLDAEIIAAFKKHYHRRQIQWGLD